ncbi:amino acid permease-domain-containing protein [Pisolithus orientalis]|uniref:amino acid permease-domain-containing protein n=1 Tax=Pisolithus orientalis TaxID=936130 RepID=UPI00222481FC|nr:amino acid permease-domain-containing protein [Pisolithus orientalis]KAI6015111.1 amino acid permease-domain-containing protein [Pisolithus orientalis]
MTEVAANWITIEPPHLKHTSLLAASAGTTSISLPASDEPQFAIVFRRQRVRSGGEPKFTAVPSRFSNLTNDFEFAGWGTISQVNLTPDDLSHGKDTWHNFHNQQVLGLFEASALAANDILGGVFYTLPSVFAISGVYSPISLFVAALSLFLWRPVMEELGSALPISGAPYTYLLNVSTKFVALVGAALLLLDFAATAVTSAATAMAYLAGELAIPFPLYVGTLLVFVLFTAVSLAGLRESARVASGVLSFHVVASVVTWAFIGSSQLKANWTAGHAETPVSVLRHVFNGACVGMLGLTGFECAPAYAAKMRQGSYPSVLRTLHLSALVFNTTISILVLALVPLGAESQGNVLSVLADKVAGRWLRIWVAVDAVVVLCAGVLTGVLTACELLCELSRDRVLPRIFRAPLPLTGAPYMSVLCFIGFSIAIYASTGANLTIISEMFSVTWLAVMMLFPISLILLRFSRPRLPRASQCSLTVIIGAIVVSTVVLAGNIGINPAIAGWFSLYFSILVIAFSVANNKVTILRWMYWTYDQLPLLHEWKLIRGWGTYLISLMRRLKRQQVCIFVNTDEINYLFNMILYVRQNEETSHLKIVYFCKGTMLPELEANAKILDEAFPEITIDLVLVEEQFTPQNVAALAHRLKTPTSLMFMSCPGPSFPYSAAEFGTRIISI